MATSYPTPWGATRTTSFTTTATAAPGEVVYFQFPTLASLPPLEYTTLPSPTSPNSKQYPNGQPILVLTQVDGVIVNSRNSAFTTATIIQAVPTPYNDPNGVKLGLVAPSYEWSSWTSAERGGVIAAIILSILLLVGLSVYTCLIRKKRKRIAKDMEDGPDLAGRKNKVRFALPSILKRGKPQKTDQGGSRGGIEGLENIEMGTAAAAATRGDPSSAQTNKKTSRTRERLPSISGMPTGSSAPVQRRSETRNDTEGPRQPQGEPQKRSNRSVGREQDRDRPTGAQGRPESRTRSVAKAAEEAHAKDRETSTAGPSSEKVSNQGFITRAADYWAE
ncbi:MAG: hypothetical protein M1827_002583 [Pycnora praestabilis]|nr:MAG: hypothetical protein M1827_002583 [Pycnora praestabilis]